MTTRNTEPAQITRNMTNKSTDSPRAEAGAPAAQPAPGKAPGPPEHLGSQSDNRIYKSGPLFVSSKGIGWTQWKKRWFILTRTSLVFFRSDPNAIPVKANEANLTLGGIDLNNSGSVEVKADKKLLTVVFPDGREGRTFTLKAETSEDLNDWKIALENALSQAPPPAKATGENADSGDNMADSVDGSSDQSKDTQPAKSSVIGRPILLALEDVDGTPSFLEKALRFIEDHGSKVEGILRQAADVELVERRVLDYEQGKTEFSEEEDAHVVGDCVKHVLREMPSSPVPASCCKALLETVRAERGKRVNAMKIAVCDTFPEPNRRLLQRILLMMQKVAANKNQNRMSNSAVAACMAPLLLRPLLAGECEIEHDFDVGGDGSAQLLQAAAAANHAQAIVITLLEEYDSIFGEGSSAGDLYDNSEESGTESGEDDESYEDDEDEEEYDGSSQGTEGDDDGASQETDADDDAASGEMYSDVDDEGSNDPNDKEQDEVRATTSVPRQGVKNLGKSASECKSVVINHRKEPTELEEDDASDSESEDSEHHIPPACIQKSLTIANGPPHSSRKRSGWGRTAAKKNLSMESMNYSFDDEAEIQRLEAAKKELQKKIEEEAKENKVLLLKLEKRRVALRERRLALEQDVAGLQEQLEKERKLRAALEAGLGLRQGPSPDLSTVDKKTREELEGLAMAEGDVTCLTKKVSDLGMQLNEQRQHNSSAKQESNNKHQQTSNDQNKEKDKHDIMHSDSNSSRTKGCKIRMTTEVGDSKKSQESGDKHANPDHKPPASESHSSKGSGGSQSPHIRDKRPKDTGTGKLSKIGSREYR